MAVVELTRAIDRRGVRQVVVTTRPPGAPRRERFGEHSAIVRLGLPLPYFRQGYAWPAAVVARGGFTFDATSTP